MPFVDVIIKLLAKPKTGMIGLNCCRKNGIWKNCCCCSLNAINETSSVSIKLLPCLVTASTLGVRHWVYQIMLHTVFMSLDETI